MLVAVTPKDSVLRSMPSRRNLRWLIQKVFFKMRWEFHPAASRLRRLWWTCQGAEIGSGTLVPRLMVTWPHQLRIGRHCRLEPGIYFKFDGVWQPGPSIIIGDGVFIGRDCEFNIRAGARIGDRAAIASGVKIIDHDHAIAPVGESMGEAGREEVVTIEHDAWLGANVIVLRGVTVGAGAIVAAGAVVTKSIPANEIWGGVPARKIGSRPASAS